MTVPICPCDGADIASPANLPQLSHIGYRVGSYADFRRAVLTPLDGEVTLANNGVPVWRTDGAGDLAVMIAEWFAYIADILTFYNERIANQDYLRTADLPESVAHLIALLGYRPRPAIGATGSLAALVTAGQSALLPKGLQFQSKPTPGQAPQIFELSADTPISPPDQIPAAPPPVLLAGSADPPQWTYTAYRSLWGKTSRFSWMPTPTPSTQSGNYNLLLRGAVDSVDPDALLMLRPRDPSLGDPLLAQVTAVLVEPAPSGGQQTKLSFSLSDTPPDGMTAAQARLETPNQSTNLWSLYGGAIDGDTVHLASLVRQIRPGHWLLFTASGFLAPPPVLAKVLTTAETIWDATGTASAPTTPARRRASGADTPHRPDPDGGFARRVGRRRQQRHGAVRLGQRRRAAEPALCAVDRLAHRAAGDRRDIVPRDVGSADVAAGRQRRRHPGHRQFRRRCRTCGRRAARSGTAVAAAVHGTAQPAVGHARQDGRQ